MLANIYHDLLYRPIALQVIVALVLLCIVRWAIAADEIQFNTDVLDVKDRSNIDLSQFSQRDYIMPGSYQMSVHANQQVIPEQTIEFFHLIMTQSSVCLVYQ